MRKVQFVNHFTNEKINSKEMLNNILKFRIWSLASASELLCFPIIAKSEDYGKMLSKCGRNQPRNLYPDKLSINSEGRIKTFSDIRLEIHDLQIFS